MVLRRWCLEGCRGLLSREVVRGCAHVVVRSETEHDLAMHIPALQSPVQIVVRGSEHGC